MSPNKQTFVFMSTNPPSVVLPLVYNPSTLLSTSMRHKREINQQFCWVLHPIPSSKTRSFASSSSFNLESSGEKNKIQGTKKQDWHKEVGDSLGGSSITFFADSASFRAFSSASMMSMISGRSSIQKYKTGSSHWGFTLRTPRRSPLLTLVMKRNENSVKTGL